MKKLIIIGDSLFAQIAYEYFTYDSDFTVVGFSVEAAYLKQTSLFNLPITPFESLQQTYKSQDHSFFVAIPYTQLNRLRKRLYLEAKAKGFQPASYISSKAFVWKNTQYGEHCFIFENNTVQPFVTLGDNVILWSGNHIGHHSSVGSHTFVSSQVVISGGCKIGESCFFGVNSTVINDLEIGSDTLVGAGALVTKSTKPGALIKGASGQLATSSSWNYFEISN